MRARSVRIRGIARLIALLAIGWAACAAPVEIDRRPKDPAAGLTEDGLYEVNASRIGRLYLRPGVDLSSYDAVMIDPCTLAYESPPEAKSILERKIGNYLLDADSSERLKRTVLETIADEIAHSESFRVMREAAPNVLRLSCHIVDFLWEVPDPLVGESFWVRRTGLMTLVANIEDSESGTPLARLADRAAIQPLATGQTGAFENRSPNSWAGVKEVSRQWARVLRETLDLLHAADPVEARSSKTEPRNPGTD